EIFDDLYVLHFDHRFEIDRGQIAALLGEVEALVKDVRDSATHAGGEIPATRSEHKHKALGHVFAAVVANSFDYGGGSRVAHGEALPGDSVEKCFTAGRPVERDIADQDVFFRDKFGVLRWTNNQTSPGQPLADIIVSVAFERERDTFGEEGTKTLAG